MLKTTQSLCLSLFCFLFLANTSWAQDQNRALIQSFLESNREQLGLTTNDISNWTITDQYQSDHNGVHHVYIRQRHAGVEVFNAVANFNIKDGKVVSMGNRLFANMAAQANGSVPSLNPMQAIEAAAKELNLTISEPLRTLEPISTQHFVFSGGGISNRDIEVKLVYQNNGENELRLAWDMTIYQKGNRHWWSLRLDAETGKIIEKQDLMLKCTFSPDPFGRCTEPTHNHQATFSPLEPNRPSSSSMLPEQYRVFAIPLESPNHGSRSLEVQPRDILASPHGWHDTNNAAGAEYTITRGNNVYAYEDRDDNDLPGYSPDGTAALNFDFPLNMNQAPIAYEDVAITNLFYMNNIMHDVWYRYGFTEASGNFQQNNYGRGGAANDYVLAEAQDGGGTNNANFGTPADGGRPTMQMYLWTANSGAADLMTVNSPSAIARIYSATEAVFGPGVPSTPITANVVLAIDGTTPVNDACEAITNTAALSGKIAILYRGSCNFTVKVQNAQTAGAVAVIVVNNVAGAPVTMGGTNTAITIPSIMISDTDGAAIIAQLNGGTPVNATIVNTSGGFDKDGDFDNGIIAHEYGHGISNRLTGGPSNSNCLGNAEQMGEGWSDFFGLMLTMKATDVATTSRGIGTFATGQPTTGGGIRNAPYTTNMSVNNYTYASTNNTTAVSQPHGIGFVWCTMLWDLNWAFIDRYGYDANVYTGTGGNNKVMRLVMDGLKLQPCNPGFVDGRNAILQADQNLNGGANQCLIWEVFARRGLGFSASQGSATNRTDQVEAFDLPSACLVPVVPPLAAFSPTFVSSCGGTIQFTDQSTRNPQSWSWTFGDGSSDTTRNPTHTYAASGTYTVRLIASNSIGSDTISTNVTVTYPPTPVVPNGGICGSGSATLNGTATGTIIWYNAAGTNPLDTGLTFTTPVLTGATTYMAENVIFYPARNVGPFDNALGAGGYHNSTTTGTINFTASKPFTLVSAWVDAGAAGNRTFYLWNGANASGSIVSQVTVNVPNGASRIQLNLYVPGPGIYSIGGSSVNLFRNTAGAAYPYNLAGVVTLTSSSATNDPAAYFYYLYDWEVIEAPCRSPKVPVNVTSGNASFSHVNSGGSVQFTDQTAGSTGWSWDFGDGNTSTAQNPQHSYTANGTYVVTLTVNGTCSTTDTILITAVSTSFLNNDTEVTLMPNPAAQSTNLQFSQALKEDIQVQVIALDGRILQESTLRLGETMHAIDLSRLSPAMYFVRLKGSQSSQTIKLTKQE